MSKGYSIKAENKPTLFTWDIETEYQNIDREIESDRTKDTNRLEPKRTQLRQLRLDFHDIVVTKEVNADQVARLFDLVRLGKDGVWQPATTTIERLAYHFDQVRNRLSTDLSDSDSKYLSRLVT